MDTEDTEARNTEKKRSFCGTWHGFPENYSEIFKESGASKGAFQLEIGEETQKTHVQWAIYFENAREFKTIKKKFKGAHIEAARNWFACLNYVKKSKTAIKGTYESFGFAEEVEDPLMNRVLRPFQEEILSIIEEKPDDRSIYWYWEENGNVGKTALAKHLVINRKDVLYLSGSAKDMKFGIHMWLKKHKLRVVILDLTRCQENFISWEGIEAIKNGLFYNTKYESEMVCFNSPHVIVFANFSPNLENLSSDRWIIRHIVNYEGTEMVDECAVTDHFGFSLNSNY